MAESNGVERTIPQGAIATHNGACTLCRMAIHRGESWVVPWDHGWAHKDCVDIELATDENPDAEGALP